MNFQTAYSRKSQPPEKNDGTRHVDKTGFIPAKIRIENLINAGRRLVESRSEMYDFPDGKEDDDYIDITRNPNFDMADASAIQNALNDKIRAQKALKKEQPVHPSPEVKNKAPEPSKEQ